ncbi:MAG: DsbE family thiol:disulfide interchange protein [Gammaproteobacteria bacterium]|jgi:cytochrome c biogenesis protein CcmG, thiol:disulfide interchange protein DsbE|nr:DsbE family thiol:disulfide interchange protein [Gammaproteobacteria bacterium]MBT4462616.1 DsbE family thiol:disulfide interchange protein [Gammaproteobacteria bacterium]MBT4654863.1 DsbE family thiol:disulfide interchange protein [Gammaproteobacteria bacterium]MBT5116637.1 DsbE family thiol:disulfide interchange protein [Gammaproteobacteria bacterium]MBT5761736.1 DsbE family thiol:disulfide interchange protein [Gammaproteobacteria bacterium]
MNIKISSVIFIIFIMILFFGLFVDTRVIRSPLIGKKLPNYELIELNTGYKTDISMLPGETLLLNVWASWCLECIREHRVLMDISKDQKISIIGVNYKDEKNDAIGWLEIYGNPYIYNIYDYAGQLGLDLGVYGVPETFLVDKNRVIRAKYIGAITIEIYKEEILPMIEKINENI